MSGGAGGGEVEGVRAAGFFDLGLGGEGARALRSRSTRSSGLLSRVCFGAGEEEDVSFLVDFRLAVSTSHGNVRGILSSLDCESSQQSVTRRKCDVRAVLARLASICNNTEGALRNSNLFSASRVFRQRIQIVNVQVRH